MSKKIIFLDIDGTLTEPGMNVPPASALEAVKKAQAKGNLVYLCTGRNYAMLSPLLEFGFDGYIGSSGGYVVCGDEVIYDCPMTEEQRVLALDVLKENGVFRTIECRDGSYTDEEFKEFLKENADKSGNSEMLRWREALEKSLNIRPMAEYDGKPVYKIVIMSPGNDELIEPEKALNKDFNFCIQDANEFGIVNGEVVNRKFDKGQAVLRVCEHMGISVSDSFGFGDSMNDLEMIETVGTSIVMENGSETLKAKADYVCPKVAEDGLLKGFEKFELI